MLQRLIPRRWFDRFERWWARRYGVFDYAPGSVLRLQLHPYTGPEVELSDGTVVRPGDPVAEVHVDSAQVARLHQEAEDPRRVGLQFARRLTDAFTALAAYFRDNPHVAAVAVFGNTLYWQGAERLGWEVRDLPPGFHRWFLNVWLRFLVWYYHPLGTRRTAGRARLARVRQIWMSRSRLLQLYGSARRAGSVARPEQLVQGDRFQTP
ncbi:MAG: hypothetical protein K6U07_03760 [Firmicutes bacterium]|nr:hypothetical protein [Bacillota bacterium]